jgi:dolichol kinase
VAGAVVAAGVELAPFPLDDNLTVPLVTGAAIHLMVG